MIWFRSIAMSAAFLLLSSSAVFAATVYRWVDEQGRVNYSEIVPERYLSVARPVGTPANEPSAEQQAQALERARQEKARAAATGRDLQTGLAPAVPGVAPLPPVKRPAQMPNDQTDCETWRRLYLESMECFGPYRTARRGTKLEAYSQCNDVPEPPPERCRPRMP